MPAAHDAEAAPVALVELDPAGRVRWANARARALLGEAAIPGAAFDQLLAVADREIALEYLTAPGDRALDVRLDQPPERWIELRAARGMVALIDISERKQFERHSAELADRLAAFLDASPAMLAWMEDARGRHVYANETYVRRLQLTKDDVVGKTAAELGLAPDHAVANDPRVWETVRFQFWDHAGTPFVGGAAVDVTAQREAERALQDAAEQLRQAQKLEAIGTLAGGLAHDFNNVLTVVLCNTAILAREVTSPAARAQIADIETAATRAARLTRQLLTFSRRQPMTPRLVELNKLIADLTPMLRPMVREDLELAFDLAADAGWVVVDPGSFEQVLVNLVVNARDATPAGGSITIATARRGADEVALSVRDTGSGIDDATRARMFEPFFTTKRAGEGTGLGLPTVLGTVQQARGRIEVATAPGQGSCFTIVLPRSEASTVVERARDTRMRGGHETVLVVEDDPGVRALTCRILREAGYEVVAASDASTAQSVTDTTRIDLLMTDVVMPGIGGLELARRITARHPAIRVVYMTGYAEQIPADAGALLAKPFTAAQLCERVREVLDR